MPDSQSAPIRGKLLSVPEFAELCGLTSSQVREFITDGCPVYERGSRGRQHVLNSADLIQWLRGHVRGNNSTGPKLSDIKAQTLSLELERKRGELAPIPDVVPVANDFVVDLKSELLSSIRDELGDEAEEIAGRVLNRVASRYIKELAEEFKPEGNG